jgi:16S rRNA (cytosine1402-N4)-methyltransferase
VHARLPIFEKDMPKPILNSLGRVLPSDEEAKENVRARSAVLRVAERTSTPLPADQGASFVKAMNLVAPTAQSRKGR